MHSTSVHVTTSHARHFFCLPLGRGYQDQARPLNHLMSVARVRPAQDAHKQPAIVRTTNKQKIRKHECAASKAHTKEQTNERFGMNMAVPRARCRRTIGSVREHLQQIRPANKNESERQRQRGYDTSIPVQMLNKRCDTLTRMWRKNGYTMQYCSRQMYKVTHHTREQPYKLFFIASAATQSQPTYRESKHKHLALYAGAQVLLALLDPNLPVCVVC